MPETKQAVFTIGKLFHLTQVIDDLDVADRWYNRVFAPCRFYRAFMADAMREASLLAIGDVCIEPVQLARMPGAESSPIGKFRSRFGSRLHSIAWYVDDLEAAYDAMRAAGVRMVDVTGKPVEDREHLAKIKYFWTHPRDTHGLLEFSRVNAEFTIDPRVQPHWSSRYWAEEHSLGVTGVVAMTMVVRDLAAASAFYRDILAATETAPSRSDGRVAWKVGRGTIVELIDARSEELKAFGEGVFGMTFHVRDLDGAAQHLDSIELPFTRHENGTVLVVAPADALGTTVSFMQAQPEGTAL